MEFVRGEGTTTLGASTIGRACSREAIPREDRRRERGCVNEDPVQGEGVQRFWTMGYFRGAPETNLPFWTVTPSCEQIALPWAPSDSLVDG